MDEKSGSTGDEGGAGTGRFERAREYVGTSYNTIRERVDDVDFGAITDQVRSYVRSNPGKALLISVGVGFLVGLLLRGGEDDED